MICRHFLKKRRERISREYACRAEEALYGRFSYFVIGNAAGMRLTRAHRAGTAYATW